MKDADKTRHAKVLTGYIKFLAGISEIFCRARTKFLTTLPELHNGVTKYNDFASTKGHKCVKI